MSFEGIDVASIPYLAAGKKMERYPCKASSCDSLHLVKATAKCSHLDWSAAACARQFPSSAMCTPRSLYGVEACMGMMVWGRFVVKTDSSVKFFREA
jgi:hypothetical protein